MSKSFEMDENLYVKGVIYIQVHSDEDIKCYLIFLLSVQGWVWCVVQVLGQ